MQRMWRHGIKVLAGLVALVAALWVTGVMWFHLDGALGGIAAAVWLFLCLSVCVVKGRSRMVIRAMLAVGVLVAVVFWSLLKPLQDRSWSADVAQRLAVVAIDGSRVTLANVRDFHWRNDTDFDPVWGERQYDLSQLHSGDVILSYWMGPAIAHTLVSFGFTDGRQLVFSLEIRKEADESFDALAGFFRRYEMTLVAAEETDIVQVRSNVRGEDVYLYRLTGLDQAALQALFMSYLEQAQALDRRPAFYNTLTSNCTTIVWSLAHSLDPSLPVDWRLIASGYLPGYLKDRGMTAPGVDMKTLQARGHINPRAMTLRPGESFSTAIRRGVPGIESRNH